MMNRNLEIFDADVTLSLDDTPLPMHLPVGAAIFAIRGKVWITRNACAMTLSCRPVSVSA